MQQVITIPKIQPITREQAMKEGLGGGWDMLPDTAWRYSLKRHPANPLFAPDPTSPWECVNVFNPSVIHHEGLFHMHYRAEGNDWISRIGYAVSRDGIHWDRLREPVLSPIDELESKGVQDPRVVRLDDAFYMTYTAWSPYREGACFYGNIYPMLARSTNLISWERLGPMVRGEDNKDHVLFPRRLSGQFCAFHRRRPDIWIAWSDRLDHWPLEQMTRLASARPECPWEGRHIGLNGPPIETEHGWLTFYHGADHLGVYRIGVMLLDRDDPSRIIARPEHPILWPEEIYETRGDVPNVVFSCANLLVGDTVYVYYGGGDHVIGLATTTIDELMTFVLS